VQDRKKIRKITSSIQKESRENKKGQAESKRNECSRSDTNKSKRINTFRENIN